MHAVGIKALKNRLSEYVKLAAGGETVLVTDRGRVVAELAPPSPGRSPRLDDARLAELVRSGLLSPPLRRSHEPPPRAPVVPLAELLAELEAARSDR